MKIKSKFIDWDGAGGAPGRISSLTYDASTDELIKNAGTSSEERLSIAPAGGGPAQIYVSGTGNDETGDGTEGKPYRQISKAVSVVQPHNGSKYTVYVDGGTYSNFEIAGGKQIDLTLRGDVTIQPTAAVSQGIYIKDHSIVQVLNDGTRRALTFVNCYGGIVVENSNLKINGSVSSLTAGALCNRALIEAKENAYVMLYGAPIVREAGSDIAINTTFSCWYGSRMYLNLSSLTMGNSSLRHYMFLYATYASHIFLSGSNQLVIPNAFTYGLYAANGSIIAHSGIGTNNATTPTKTSDGGRIFTGAQEA